MLLRTSTSSALIALLLGALSASARADVPSFSPGEQSTYEVSYLGMRAGVAQVTVGSEVEQWGKQVWPLVTVARSDASMKWFPVRDKFVSYWDAKTQETVGNDLYADENHKRSRQRVMLDQVEGRAKVMKQKEGEAVREHEVDVKRGTRDVTAVTFALRSQALAVGEEYHFPVYTGAKSFDMVARVEGTEQLDTALGKREVFRIRMNTEFSGKLKSRRDLVAYFTTDALHLPVRIEAEFVLGKLVAQLTDYQPGRQLASLEPAGR
jgi:hypothetical protein